MNDNRFSKPNKQQAESIKNPKVTNLGTILGAYERLYKEQFNEERTIAYEEINQKLCIYPICVFIRGTHTNPQCKSSKKMLELLNKMEIKFRSFNILEDFKLKEWLKFYSDFQNFP